MSFEDRVVLVTGASSGIGEQLALDFASRGARLALVARRGDRLAEVGARCEARGAPVLLCVGDLAQRSFVSGLVPRVLSHYGRLDVLVNNAGIPKHKQIYDVTSEDVDQTLAVNLTAPILLTLAALPAMLRQGGGSVVFVSSLAGRLPPPRETIYAASKFGLTGFGEGLQLDLQGSGISCCTIHVGPVDTEIWERAAEEAPVRFSGRKLPPSDVSRAVFRCLETKRSEIYVPRWGRLMHLLCSVAPGATRRGAGRYDPVPAEVLEAARRAAAD